jgi:transposase-like protein
MTKFEGSTKDFVRSLPRELPTADVIARAKEVGLTLSKNQVHKARSAIRYETNEGLATQGQSKTLQRLYAFCQSYIDKHGQGPALTTIQQATRTSRGWIVASLARLRHARVIQFARGNYATMKILSPLNEGPPALPQNGSSSNGAVAAMVVRPKEQDGQERQTFTLEFKREAVKLAKKLGSIAEAARQLGVGSTVLARWSHGGGLSRNGRQGTAIDIARRAVNQAVRNVATPAPAPARPRSGTKIPIEQVVNHDLLKLVASEIGLSRSIEILQEEQNRMLTIFRRATGYRVTGHHEEAS